jgi:hypothetical protein
MKEEPMPERCTDIEASALGPPDLEARLMAYPELRAKIVDSSECVASRNAEFSPNDKSPLPH